MSNFDVVGAVELTASAAIVVAVLSIVMGRDTAQRIRRAAILSGWFVIVAVLAATGALGRERGIGVPGLGAAVAIPIVLMSLGLIFAPVLRKALDRAALSIVVGVHFVRILGVSFLILYANNRLPAPFAPVAGWGDIFVGLTAIPAAWLAHRQLGAWRAALAVWNALGLADLIAAVSLGVLSSAGPLHWIDVEPGTDLMTTLPWLLIPGFLVPLLITTHLAIFYRLIKSAPEHTPIEATVGKPLLTSLSS